MRREVKIRAAKRVIREAGGLAAMARIHGISRQAVQDWLRHGIPAERVQRTAAVLGLSVSDVRPDVFGE